MSATTSPQGPPSQTYDSAFLKACRREPVPHTPVWFMRQAGRSLPEYRKVREGTAMLATCRGARRSRAAEAEQWTA